MTGAAYMNAPAGSGTYETRSGDFKMGTLDDQGRLVYPSGTRNPETAVAHYERKLFDESGAPLRGVEERGKKLRKLAEARAQYERDQQPRQTNLQQWQDIMHKVYEPTRVALTEGAAVAGQTEANRASTYAARSNQKGGFAENAQRQIAATTQNRILGANLDIKQKEATGALAGVERDRSGVVGLLTNIPQFNPMTFSPSGSYAQGLGQFAGGFGNAMALKDPTQKKEPKYQSFYGTGDRGYDAPA
jgi:hypothetical protein